MKLIRIKEHNVRENEDNEDLDSHHDRDRAKRRERSERWNQNRENERRYGDEQQFEHARPRSPCIFQKPTDLIESSVSATKNSTGNSLIPVLRHVSLLESHLGSLGSKALELLSEALYLEKISDGSANRLVSREECFLETLREKLIGLLEVGVMDKTFSDIADTTVQNLRFLLSSCKSGTPSSSAERAREVTEGKGNNSSNFATVTNYVPNPPSVLPTIPGPPVSSLMPNVWGGVTGPMGYPMMGLEMMNPNMLMRQIQFGIMPPAVMTSDGRIMGPNCSVIPPEPSFMHKDVIRFKTFTLFPPDPRALPQAISERPPGCRTIYVGGLPESITEEMLREIFSRCGEILYVRLKNKTFGHVRFVHEASVDAALFFSGFKICIGFGTEAAVTGRLHIDYSSGKYDQNRCQQQLHHHNRIEKERFHSPSPPPVIHYTSHEANLVAEKIKNEEHFSEAVEIVISWLEKGSCNKRNVWLFYSMIQSTNSHVRRLLSEKASYEEELRKAKDNLKNRTQEILKQFDQIEQVFTAASHKKVWDHFTKPQRKNIEMWKKQTTELKSIELEDNTDTLTGGEDEMDLSDNEDDNKKLKDDILHKLKDENENLRCQLEAYKNEMDLLKFDHKAELQKKDNELMEVQQSMQGLNQQLLDAKHKGSKDKVKMTELEKKVKIRKSETKDVEIFDRREKINNENVTKMTDSVTNNLSQKEVKLIGLMTIFLHIHPFGASTDYIWSYLHKIEPSLKSSDIEELMIRFPSIFQQEVSGIGANMERRWVFGGFKIS